jgi:hypothetical protein
LVLYLISPTFSYRSPSPISGPVWMRKSVICGQGADCLFTTGQRDTYFTTMGR